MLLVVNNKVWRRLYGPGSVSKVGPGLQIVLPDCCRRLLPAPVAPEIIFCPATPSGSLAQTSLREIVQLATEADCFLVAGDLSANQQTTTLIKSLLEQVMTPTIVAGDGWRAWPRRHLTGDHQILVWDVAATDRYLKDWDEIDASWPPTRPVWQTILANPEISRLNLVCNRWQTDWVKIGDQMCYNQKSTASPALDLAIEVAFYGALYPERLFAAAAAAVVSI